jgi:pyridoxal phosphate enzyme (YggS family)
MTTTGAAEQRLGAVRAAIAEAAVRAGRRPEEIRIVAASKYAGVEAIEELARAGQRDFGENYVQPAIEKMRALAHLDLRWHFIGALQSNKAARAARVFHLVHTVAGESALAAIAKAMEADQTTCRILVQVRLAEGERAGVAPQDAAAFVRAACGRPGIVVDGVMGLPPAGEPARPHFARLRAVLEDLRMLRLDAAPLTEMSAGMTEDFADAILEGSTMVRIGRALFEAPQSEGRH